MSSDFLGYVEQALYCASPAFQKGTFFDLRKIVALAGIWTAVLATRACASPERLSKRLPGGPGTSYDAGASPQPARGNCFRINKRPTYRWDKVRHKISLKLLHSGRLLQEPNASFPQTSMSMCCRVCRCCKRRTWCYNASQHRLESSPRVGKVRQHEILGGNMREL